MANDHYEREYDDEVYEDDFYDEHFNEEELEDESDRLDSSERDVEIDDPEETKKVVISYACEDCDYRWEDQVTKRRDGLEDDLDEDEIICPMCGSMNITLI